MPPKKKIDVKAAKADKVKADKKPERSPTPEKTVPKSKTGDKTKDAKSKSKDIKPDPAPVA